MAVQVPRISTARGASRRGWWCALLLVVVAWPGVASPQPDEDTVPALLSRLETILVSGRPDAYLTLVAPSADRDDARTFAVDHIVAGTTRATVRERERTPIPASSDAPDRAAGVSLIVDVLIERGDSGIVSTWRLEIEPVLSAPTRRVEGPVPSERPADPAADLPEDPSGHWRIRAQDRLSHVDRLYRLRLDPTRQYSARGLRIRGEDLTLHVHEGVAHVATAEDRWTAIVIVGRGEMVFRPAPAAEQGQVRIFSGSDTLRAGFTRTFVRINPADLDDHLEPSRLTPVEQIDRSALERAQELFDTQIERSFSLDLSDLSRDTWSLVPGIGDALADVDTDRFGVLTYARSRGDPEDIALFDRRRQKNIAVYASADRLARRGRRFDNAERLEYEVYRYDVDVTFSPERQWIEGRTGIALRVRAYALSTLTLRLAEPLVVRAVVAEGFGRVLALRVRGQNSFIVNLPGYVRRDEWLTLQVFYAGRLPSQGLDREAIVLGPSPQVVSQDAEGPFFEPEPRFLYSNRSYWYPQAMVNQFSRARLRLTVPERWRVVASGMIAPGGPTDAPAVSGDEAHTTYVFEATQPLRYLSVIVSRLRDVTTGVAAGMGARGTDAPRRRPGVYYDRASLNIVANPRQTGRARGLGDRAVEILELYQSLLGDAPYPALTLAAVDDVLPGGHSPAYLAMLNQPTLPTTLSWRNDPVNFDNFPDFFLAHELAHQYWGQAVGWESYHEQWISEGFAQFFALLYAEQSRGRGTWRNILRQMRRSVLQYPDQGPVWLGYRLGHLESDSRVFRAIVYNKGALVLHMLRQWLGDELFFRGLRRFYDEARFRRVGTEAVRRAFEAESGRALTRFFERWIYDDDIPEITVSWQEEVRVVDPTTSTPLEHTLRDERSAPRAASGVADRDSERVVRVYIRQHGEPFDLPLPLELHYDSGEREQVLLRLSTRVTDVRLPLKGPLRQVRADPDEIALVRISR